MKNVGYIGYKPNTIGFGETTLATGGVALPITAIVDTVIAVVPFLIPFISNIFAHPAADARGVISDVKKALPNLDARNRMAYVLAATQKISPKAKDVEANELILWYKQNYPNDYQTLLADDKIYWNNFLLTNAQKYQNVNDAAVNYQRALFTDSEINYGVSPVTALFSNKNNLLLYGGIALAILLLIKK